MHISFLITLPDCFGVCWLCVPAGSNSLLSFVASHIGLLDFLFLLFINCCEPNTTITSYLFDIPVFGITDCFNSSGTCFMETLDSLDYSNFALEPCLSNVLSKCSQCLSYQWHSSLLLSTFWVAWDMCPGVSFSIIRSDTG